MTKPRYSFYRLLPSNDETSYRMSPSRREDELRTRGERERRRVTVGGVSID